MLGAGRSGLTLPPEEIIFAGEREDLEELTGNLLENATKWGHDTILITVSPLPDPNLFRMTVEDDGPGIPEDKAREALKRGKRLDKVEARNRLGLAIVADLVSEYSGRLALERSELGGLKAIVELKRAQ